MQLRKKLLTLLGTLLITILCCTVGYADTHPACTGGPQHEFESHILVLNSEESEGQVENVCTLCGYTYIEYLPATGHKYDGWKTIEERPESKTRTERRECLVCHRAEVRTIRTTSSSPETESIQEEKSEKHGINQMDYILSSSIGGVWVCTAAVLWYNGLVLNWYKRESTKRLKRR
ncbi:hypothetical protein FYJ38_18720 [Clostridium sp. WB02_MRS01]|uniref:hypothetical protein n=1 Tax=Clostridium sp. WB02_MRS01 TaxID=2605777 RepID=UPI0012B2D771|nr:hypothetical protein [Clostridium sp. WB02_MRS01]MSS10660.1 hypothetical protein [Clostridium sp. WB02_MRS01]